MSNRIIEAEEKMGGAAASIEKKARQLVYDARYEVQGELKDKPVAPAVKLKMILDRISKSTAIPAVKARAKEMVSKKPVKEEFIFTTEDTASESVASAMFKVFVEGIEEEKEVDLVYEEEMRDAKYHIRVTDPKTGRTYTRKADRQKITELRAKGLKVEMSEYRDSSERDKEGQKSAKREERKPERKEVKEAKKLDPVGQEDGDIDNDGDEDETDSYLHKRRKVIGKAIAKKKGKKEVKEDFLIDGATGTTSTEGQNSKKIDIKSAKDKSYPVTIFPEVKEQFIEEKAKSKAQQRFMAMVYKKKKKGGKASPEVEDAAKGMSEKEAKKYASTKHEGLPEKKKKEDVKEEANCPKCGKCPCECDNRAKKTYRDLLKNKMRAMGIKNPMILGDMDAEDTMKAMTSSSAKMAMESSCGGHSKSKKKKKKY